MFFFEIVDFLKILKRLKLLKFLKLQPYSFAALQPIVLFATELAGIERQALPGAGGVATGIGVSDSLAAGSLAAGSLVFSCLETLVFT